METSPREKPERAGEENGNQIRNLEGTWDFNPVNLNPLPEVKRSRESYDWQKSRLS